ncbi:MAG: cation:proton antiporter domain-containing protein, partial [Planctomycetota bacterium]
MDIWTALLDVLYLLGAAMLLGALMDRLKQSPILGYLIAGTLLGPNVLRQVHSPEEVALISELGVALLLFTIGLEFSWRRLRTMGKIALGGGTAQVLLTMAITAGVCLALGMERRPSIAVGAVVALSSTACVLRMLITRAEIESVHGRNSLGILLLQDIAVVPLVLMVAVMGGDAESGQPASAAQAMFELARAIGVAALMVAALFVLLNYVVPQLLNTQTVMRNRDLPVLLATVTAVG